MTVPEVYFWDGWQTVEEFTNTGSWGVNKQYVWGEGIDECLKATVPDAANLVAGDEIDLYFHHNSLGSVVAVTKADGTVVESYRYSAFGKPTIFNGSNVEISTTAVKQPFMFTGARYDFEEGSGLYQMRHRYYDPVVGRFVSRDPLGLWGDPSQDGNGQGYCGHDPVNWVDPLGLQDSPAAEDDVRDYGPIKWEDFRGQADPMRNDIDALTAYVWRKSEGTLEIVEVTEEKPRLTVPLPPECPEGLRERLERASLWRAKVRYPNFSITAHMNRTKSWARRGGPLLLKHEQGHLDIAEIYGRQAQDSLRKEIGSGAGATREAAIANAKKDLDGKIAKRYSLLWDIMQGHQRAYDSATQVKGQTDREMQDSWSETHRRMLQYPDGYLVDENLQPRD